MKIVKRIFIIGIIFFSLLMKGFCQESNFIPTAVPFLQSLADARGASLGNIGVATSADAASMCWNPAKYPFVNSKNGFQYTFSPSFLGVLDGIAQNYISGYKTFNNKQSIGFSLNYFTYGALPVVDNQGIIYPDDESAHELSVDFAYSRKLSEFFSMAVAFRYIYSNPIGNVEGYSAGQTFAADVSAYYEKPLSNGDFAFGCNLSNIGPKIKYGLENTALFLPSNLRIGGRRAFNIGKKHLISCNLELNKLLVPTPKPQDDQSNDFDEGVPVLVGLYASFFDAPNGLIEELQEITPAVGVEYSYEDFLKLRTGYVYKSPNKGNLQLLSFGVGVNYSRANIDFSYSVSLNSFNVPQNLGIGVGYQF